MRLALYQPDIPQNVGSIMRLCACFGVPLDIIEPCGFPYEEKRVKRSALDYVEITSLQRHASWERFLDFREGLLSRPRLVLMTTKGAQPYHQFRFRGDDILMMGRESAGVPQGVADLCQGRVVIPMVQQARSLNVAVAAAIALAEALRQTEQLPIRKKNE